MEFNMDNIHLQGFFYHDVRREGEGGFPQEDHGTAEGDRKTAGREWGQENHRGDSRIIHALHLLRHPGRQDHHYCKG